MIRKVSKKTGYDKVILAEGLEVSSDCSETNINNNICVVGGSGSGKTCSVVLPRLLNAYNSNLIVTTTKDRLYNLTHRMLEKRGFKIFRLDFAHPENSNCYWNPLDDLKSWQDLSKFAGDIVMANTKREDNSADPYWNKTAESLWIALLGYCKCMKQKATISDAIELFHELRITNNSSERVETSLDSKFGIFERHVGRDHFVCQAWHTAIDLPINTLRCVIGSLATTIDKIFTEDVLVNFSADEGREKLAIPDLGSKKTILFLNTSPVNVNLHYLVNIFYANVFAALFDCAERNGGSLDIPVNVICDDFACGSINNFQEYISVFRQAQISVTILLQSESQLESIYGDSASSIILDNCDTYVFLGSNDRISCRNIGDKIDRSISEILNMEIGKEIILRRGDKPRIYVDRYKTFEDKRYQQLVKELEEGRMMTKS